MKPFLKFNSITENLDENYNIILFHENVLKDRKQKELIEKASITKICVGIKRNESKNFDDFLEPKKVFTTSYSTYIQRTKSSFDLLNSIKGKNIYKIYPHELFCNNQIKKTLTTITLFIKLLLIHLLL